MHFDNFESDTASWKLNETSIKFEKGTEAVPFMFDGNAWIWLTRFYNNTIYIHMNI